ncbi:hypothetical protein BWI17_11565 [Betaproteobacteria bacterium GR16-43]|nr:hypothetical protein BWI17_11565 [Betaproteobacteria bacterium GR16-43]
MKFACLFYHDEGAYEAMPAAQRDASSTGCYTWVEGLKQRGQFVGATGLRSVQTATTVRARDGVVTMTDGPFAETKEQLGGLTVIEARDLDEALRIVSTLPVLRTGSIEVRPLMESV